MSAYKLRKFSSALFGVLMACVLSLTMGIFSRAAYAETTELMFPEPVQRGGVEVNKTLTGGVTQIGDAKVEGITFNVYLEEGNPVVVNGTTYYSRTNTDSRTANPVAVLPVDANGHAATANDLLPVGKYYIVEVENPKGSGMAAPGVKWNSEGTIVEITKDKEMVTYNCENSTQSGGISVFKYEPLSDSKLPLSGAEFTIYNVGTSSITYTKNGTSKTIQPASNTTNPTGDSGKVDVLVTGTNGKASLPDDSLSTGTYMIIETKAPEGYQLVGFKETFTIGSQTSYSFDVPNTANRGGITITKMDKDRNAAIPQGDATLDSTYEIQYRGKKIINVGGNEFASDGSKWITVYTVKANAATGIATTPDNLLPTGSYRVIETEAGYGYKLDSKWSYPFTIASNGQTVTIPAADANKNEVMRAGFKLVKLDKDTNQPVPQGSGKFNGIKFQLKVSADCPNSVIINGKTFQPGDVIDNLGSTLTMNNGRIETATNLLPVGRYEISELDVPAITGYLRNETWSDTFQVTPAEDGKFAKVITSDNWIWYELSDSTND